MITEEMLREAAERSCALHTEQLESACAEMPEHWFSPETEARILSMGRKHSRKAIYQFLLRTAAMLGVVFFGILQTTVVEAQSGLNWWFRRNYNDAFVYQYEGSDDEAVLSYQPTWIPEGYEEIYSSTLSESITVYENASGDRLNFMCVPAKDGNQLYLNVPVEQCEEVLINGAPAEFFPSTAAAEASVLIWKGSSYDLLCLSGFFNKETLVKIAESIQQIKNN